MRSANVLVVGGFALPPRILSWLVRDGRERGVHVEIAPLGFNVGCGESGVQAITDRIDLDDVESLIGYSRGGQLALVAANRRPDEIRRLVTVCTPWTIGPPDYPGVDTAVRALKRARRRGLPWFGSLECADGPCCTRYRADLECKPAARWTALWSSTDRIGGHDADPPRHADESHDLRVGHLQALLDKRARARVIDAVADRGA